MNIKRAQLDQTKGLTCPGLCSHLCEAHKQHMSAIALSLTYIPQWLVFGISLILEVIKVYLD